MFTLCLTYVNFYSSLKPIQKILIIRFSAIGDIILTTPVIRAVKKRYPQADLHYLTKKQYVDLVKHSPYVSKVIAFDPENTSLLSLILQLRQEKYDWIIDIHKNIRSKLIRHLLFAKRKSSYSKGYWRRFLLIRFKYKSSAPFLHVIDKYFAAIKKHGVNNDQQGTEVFYPTAIEKEIKKIFSLSGNEIVAICPGASYFTKRWTRDGFEEVGQMLMKEGKKVVYLGAENEKELCEGLAHATGAVSLAGKLNLLEAACVLQRSSFAITNDSGLMHLAESQNTPVISIFGATVPELGFAPFLSKSRIIQHRELKCRPCHGKGKRYCPKKHFDCMEKNDKKQLFKEVFGLFE